jgi:hypothetical protein
VTYHTSLKFFDASSNYYDSSECCFRLQLGQAVCQSLRANANFVFSFFYKIRALKALRSIVGKVDRGFVILDSSLVKLAKLYAIRKKRADQQFSVSILEVHQQFAEMAGTSGFWQRLVPTKNGRKQKLRQIRSSMENLSSSRKGRHAFQ